MKAFLLVLLLCFSLTNALNTDFLESEEYQGFSKPQKAQLDIFLEQDEVVAFLEQFPNWRADIYRTDESGVVWKVDFHEGEQWRGNAHYNNDKAEMFDTTLPVDLSDSEKEEARAAIHTLIFADAEVLARLENPDIWTHETTYNMYEEKWQVHFWSAADDAKELGVELYRDGEEESYKIDRLFDPAAVNAEDQEQHNRDEAINLAYTAEPTDAALNGHDNWRSYAEAQGGPLWSVAFEAKGENLITVLVDLEAGEVLETQLP